MDAVEHLPVAEVVEILADRLRGNRETRREVFHEDAAMKFGEIDDLQLPLSEEHASSFGFSKVKDLITNKKVNESCCPALLRLGQEPKAVSIILSCRCNIRSGGRHGRQRRIYRFGGRQDGP